MTFCSRIIAAPLARTTPAVTTATRRHFSASMTMGFVKRLTLFKIPKEEDIDAVLAQYETVRRDAIRLTVDKIKNGKPYIISNAASRIVNTDSPRSEGFTLASQSIFANREDHEYYDAEDPAHQELKKLTAKVRSPGGVMTVVTEGDWPEARI